jgi:cytochrome c2
MNAFFKKVIIASGIVIALFLVLEAWRENLNMDWQKYQKKYKEELTHQAQTEQDRLTASEYEIKLRQIVLPKLNRSDRCVTCHVAVEDTRMTHMEQPLTSHPGNYLDTHDVNYVGCTSCHDGQGRAITVDEAHAKGEYTYWEKPLLKKPFLQSTCVRCHANSLNQTPFYNQGKRLFETRGCFACHSVGDIGGVKGPALSDIGDASFHVKMPIHKNRDRLLKQFDGNVNLAYLHEAITEPDAQPEETLMKKVPLTQNEATSLLVYLKSLSSKRRIMDVGVSAVATAGSGPAQVAQTALQTSAHITGASAKGYTVFATYCVACHTIGEGVSVGPDLKGVTSRRDEVWLKRAIQFPSQMIEEKDPIMMQLLNQYKTPMADMGLNEEEVEEVIKYLRNPEAVSIEAGPEQAAADADGAIKKQKNTQADIAKGRALFQGRQRFLNKGPSCISCHDVRSATVFAGGGLGKELSTSYSKLKDRGMRAVLTRPPFPLMREAYREKDLTSDEVSALTAFLEHIDQEQGNQQSRKYHGTMLLMGVGGLVVLFLFFGTFWWDRKRKSVNRNMFDRQKKSEEE